MQDTPAQHEHEHAVYITFFVCGNDETLAAGTYLHHADRYDETAEAVRAACRLIDDNGGASRVERHFPDWHGGRFDQYYTRHGFVAIDQDAPQWAHDLADRANDVMAAEIGKAESACEQQDRAAYAECIDDDCITDEAKRFISEILFPAASFNVHTPASIAAALRANDASLLVVID